MTREQIRQTIERLEQMHAEESCLPLLAQAAARDALTLLRVMVGDNVGGCLPGTEGTITEWMTSWEYVRETFETIDRERKAVQS